MARTVRETALATRTARLRLTTRGKPYWRMLEQGLHIGYRRRATGGTWTARRRNERGIYREAKLGLADDLYPVHVMTRKSFGLMMRKLSVTESQRSAQFPGTFSRRKLSVASANWAQVA